MPDFIAHPYGALIAAQILEDYRFGHARAVKLPPIIGHSRTAFPRDLFDMPVKRDGEADAVTHRVA